MTPAHRLREALAAVALVGVRVHFHPNPLDWVVLLGLCWALAALATGERARKVVFAAGVFALSILYLQTQIFHMMAVADLVP